jgi:hypothetical protein
MTALEFLSTFLKSLLVPSVTGGSVALADAEVATAPCSVFCFFSAISGALLSARGGQQDAAVGLSQCFTFHLLSS